MSNSIVARWSRGEIPINRQATHCPECGYRSHGDKDAGVPVVCDECMPEARPLRVCEEEFDHEFGM